jgi:hypothetical protein
MPTNDSPTAEGATNVLLNQRSLDPPYLRQAVGIQGDENPGKALGFDSNGVLTTIAVGDTSATTSADSIATLRALPTATRFTGSQVSVAGYYSPGDGGGGQFCYDSASTVVDNGGTVIAPTSGSGRWLRIVDESEGGHIRWFGARGDDSTPNTTAIQAAIDSLATTGGTIYFPRGTYRTGELTLPSSNITFKGDGSGLSVLKWTTLGSNITGLAITGSGFRAEDMAFQGPGAAPAC